MAEFRAMQINSEVVIKIRKYSWSAKTADVSIWNHACNTTDSYKRFRYTPQIRSEGQEI
jgi:hypothetical protein